MNAGSKITRVGSKFLLSPSALGIFKTVCRKDFAFKHAERRRCDEFEIYSKQKRKNPAILNLIRRD
ncbi:hypothetical protein EYS10_04690 [Rahnella aquatilis]|nr:hypothetical protein EYS10_04690 [Rahnella aquatilis]